MKRNLFIALEGIDGSGKSTQLRLLTERLQNDNRKVFATFEPTSRPIGTMIRHILKGSEQTDHRVLAGLFVADRLDHLLNTENGIVKKMEEGFTVVCDRYCFSSYAYQGTHMDMDWVINANAMSASVLKPDVNFFIDVDPELSMERISNTRGTLELFETLETLKKVRANFFEAFEKLKNKEKVIIIDGNRKQEAIADDMYNQVERMK